MKGIKLYFLRAFVDRCQQILSILMVITCLLITTVQPAIAGINDDRYDGNIFVVYAGNGSLVPPAQTLAQTLAQHKPAILTFYVEDSSDCKKYAIVISKIQAFYGRAAELIPINVDSLTNQKSYEPTEEGYYYSGGVPQVVIFDQAGKVVFNQKGQVPYEDIDDSLRKVFDLLPRTESMTLKRRPLNELSGELVP